MLVDAVGPLGRIVGIDSSGEMLARAGALQRRHGWRNVTLHLADASELRVPERLNAVLFSLSYATMAGRQRALRLAWEQLRPNGRLVVMDAKVPEGRWRSVIQPVLVWISRLTVLGNPDARPWDDLRTLAGSVEMTERLFSLFFICRARKGADAIG